MKDAGFMISTQENGSWAVYFTDGKNWQWDYRPTAKRQPVNDGKWHFLAITHFAEKDEMKMYYDGKNVATYCTNGNKNLATGNRCASGITSITNGTASTVCWTSSGLPTG